MLTKYAPRRVASHSHSRTTASLFLTTLSGERGPEKQKFSPSCRDALPHLIVNFGPRAEGELSLIRRSPGRAKSSRGFIRTHRNSCPTTVHPLRRLLSLRRNDSATLSLSISRSGTLRALSLRRSRSRDRAHALATTRRHATSRDANVAPHLKL